MKKQGSPLKVKQYFANPLHRIRQPAFVEIGFTQSHLNTFIKAFTNRYNSRYINFGTIREFIASFTNNSVKLTQMYEHFFLSNFKVTQHGDILLEQFVQFFNKEEGSNLSNLSLKAKKKLFAQMGQLNADNIEKLCQELAIPLQENQSSKIVNLINMKANASQRKIIQESTFIQALQSD